MPPQDAHSRSTGFNWGTVNTLIVLVLADAERTATQACHVGLVDPRGIKSRTLFDDAGRRVASIANYVDGTPW